MLQACLARRMSNTHTRPRTLYSLHTWYRGSSTYAAAVLPKQGSTQQGDPLGMLLSLVAQPLEMYIQATFRPLLNLWMADDGNVVAPIAVAQKIYEYIKS